MCFVKSLLSTFVLNDTQTLRGRVDLDAFTLQALKRIYIYIFYFKGNQVSLLSKLVYSIIVHQVALKESMTAEACGGFCTRIKHYGANIVFEGFSKEHLSELSSSEYP